MSKLTILLSHGFWGKVSSRPESTVLVTRRIQTQARLRTGNWTLIVVKDLEPEPRHYYAGSSKTTNDNLEFLWI